MILVDTSVIIDLINGKRNAAETLKKLRGKFGISSITVAEVGIGFRIKDQPNKEAVWNKLVDSDFEILAITTEVAKTYANIQAKLMKTTGQLSGFDGLIAATAISHNIHLLTSDVGFKRVPGLKLA